MNFTCDNCQRRYSVADEKVRGKTVKIRCRACDTLVTVVGPPAQGDERASGVAARPNPSTGVGAVALASEAPASPSGKTPWDDEATVAAPALSGKSEWFAMVKGKQVGPFDPRGVADLVRSGEVSLKSYLWRKGMPEWKRGADVPELAPVFAGLSAGAAPAPKGPPPPRASPAVPEPSPLPRPPASPPAPAAKAAPPVAIKRPPRIAEPIVAPAATDLPFDPPAAQPPTASQVGKLMGLGELFSESDLPSRGEPDVSDEPTQVPLTQGSKIRQRPKKEAPPGDDPFAGLGGMDESMLAPPGEATRFFIAQAGVNKRNPWWKTVGFIAGGVGILAGVFFALASNNVVPLRVRTFDASTGKEVEQSVFSGEGVNALGDMLMGRKKNAPPPPPQPEPQKGPAVQKGPGLAAKDPKSQANMPKIDTGPKAHVPTQEELAALYADPTASTRGPRIRKDAEAKATNTNAGALSAEQISRVVQQSQSAFQSCIEQELRKNPNMRVPRFYIVATVAPSGVVKSTSIDRKDVDNTNLGECLKTRARRMTFAQFEGEEVDIEIPLIVGTAM